MTGTHTEWQDTDDHASPAHLAWLEEHREQLLDFYQPHVVNPDGGYFWLGNTGRPMPEQGCGLWVAARMVHSFSIAHLLGRPGARDVAQHGVAYLARGAARDAEYGGWYAAVTPTGTDERKELYGLAHVILAASTATAAGLDGARELLDDALALVDSRYWESDAQAGLDALDRTLAVPDAYRGLNANMHLTEAFLAAYEAKGDEALVDRALGLAERFVQRQLDRQVDGPHRLVEHFDEQWRPLPDYNRDEPAHPFRPYGSTPGHWLEWAKLCVQIAGLRPEVSWLVPAAQELFAGSVDEAWAPGGGFYYTVDWDGAPVISNRYFWGVAEGIGAAHMLRAVTGETYYSDWYARLWKFAREHLIDGGSWHSELDDNLRPTTRTWDGRPDLYHVLQATLYRSLPADEGLIRRLAG